MPTSSVANMVDRGVRRGKNTPRGEAEWVRRQLDISTERHLLRTDARPPLRNRLRYHRQRDPMATAIMGPPRERQKREKQEMDAWSKRAGAIALPFARVPSRRMRR
jgi:hypothetical protein